MEPIPVLITILLFLGIAGKLLVAVITTSARMLGVVVRAAVFVGILLAVLAMAGQ